MNRLRFHDRAASRGIDAGRRGRLRERGETLIELSATIVLMGFGVVAVVGMIFTLTKVSGMHRGTTTANTWVHNIGESVIDQHATPYVTCANDYAVTTLPQGYDADIISVERLADPLDPNASWVPMGVGCIDDGGVQRVTVEAWSLSNPAQRERLQVVKRDTTCTNTVGEDC